jgi:hypothetical protein
MTTCAILADSHFERQRKCGTALVKTPGRVIGFAIKQIFLRFVLRPQQFIAIVEAARRSV